MPLYTWRGVDLQGTFHQGKTFARSSYEIEQLLIEQGIGLIRAQKVFFVRSLSTAQKDAFFAHLAALLCAHIPLYQALMTIAATAPPGLYKMISEACASRVSHGVPLIEALDEHGLSDPLAHSLLCVGEKTGTLGPVLQHIVMYNQQRAAFASRVRAALFGPLITLSFFVLMMVILLVWVIPQFENYFATNQIPLPWITVFLLFVSKNLTMHLLMWISSALVIIGTGLVYLLSTQTGRSVKHFFLDRLPYIGSFRLILARTHMLRIVSLLLHQDVPLAEACKVYGALVSHPCQKKALEKIQQVLEEGTPLSVAWRDSLFSCPEVEVFLALGETTGQLARLMSHASDLLEKRLYTMMHRWTTLLNPLLLVGIAGLIAGLIYSLYMPLILLSASSGIG